MLAGDHGRKRQDGAACVKLRFPIRGVAWSRPEVLSPPEPPLPFGTRNVPDLLEFVAGCRPQVESFLAASEEEFLSLGNALRQAVGFAQQVTETSQRIIALAAGEQGVLGDARTALSHSLETLATSAASFSQEVQALGRNGVVLKRLASGHSDLQKIVAPLQFITLYLSIEGQTITATDGPGFDDLREQMMSLR